MKLEGEGTVLRNKKGSKSLASFLCFFFLLLLLFFGSAQEFLMPVSEDIPMPIKSFKSRYRLVSEKKGNEKFNDFRKSFHFFCSFIKSIDQFRSKQSKQVLRIFFAILILRGAFTINLN